MPPVLGDKLPKKKMDLVAATRRLFVPIPMSPKTHKQIGKILEKHNASSNRREQR